MVHHGMCFTGRKDARSKIHASVNFFPRCFLRVREDNVSGAAFGLSTKKRVRKLLCFPTLFLCSAGDRRLRAEWDAVPRPAGALPLTREGSAPDFSELARKNCPARATAPWTADRASRLNYNFVRPRRITILFPALSRLRRSWVQGHAPAAARARTVHCQKIPLRSSKSAAGMGL